MDEEKITEETKTKEIKTEKMKEEKKTYNSKLLDSLNVLSMIMIIIMFFLISFIIGIKANDSFMHKAYVQEIGFKNVGELVTQTAYIRVFEDSSKDRTLSEILSFLPNVPLPFTKSRLIISSLVEVDAAINFEEIKINNIDDENKTISLIIPHARIYKQPTLIVHSEVIHLDSESIFSNINEEERKKIQEDMIVKAENEAISNGLLEKADDHGKRLIESFIKENERYKGYEIKYYYIEQ